MVMVSCAGVNRVNGGLSNARKPLTVYAGCVVRRKCLNFNTCYHIFFALATLSGTALMAVWLRRCHWLPTVSHHCSGLNPSRSKWESSQWLGVRRWFSGFLHHLQLASHDLAAIWQKKWRKPIFPATLYRCKICCLKLQYIRNIESFHEVTKINTKTTEYQ